MDTIQDKSPSAQELVKYINYRGKHVLFCNARNVSDVELLRQTLSYTIDTILKEPEKSVLFLGDASNANFNTKLVEECKTGIKKVTPNIRASAYVGLGGLQEIILKALAKVTKRNVKTFRNLHDAKEWLCSQG